MIKLTKLWLASNDVYPRDQRMKILRRIRFCARGIREFAAVEPFLIATEYSALGKLMRSRPETIGAVEWPYLCTEWDAKTRLSKIANHYSELSALETLDQLEPTQQISLLDVVEVRPDLTLVLDQPKWFLREGQLTLNLFIEKERIFSLVFLLGKEGDQRVAFVGAIQGRDYEGVLDDYRELTKQSHGMRPRDFLFELFRMFCASLGVRRILAVSDECRHHRSRYFGATNQKEFSTNYNEIWEDRSGVRQSDAFYELSPSPRFKDLATIPAKKRGMYRRRYEMLDTIRTRLEGVVENLRTH